MIEYILTTAKELDNESVGTVIIDPNGYAWQKGSHTKTIGGEIRSFWFNAVSGESQLSDTLEKDGPYTVVHTPDQTDPAEPQKMPQREYVTQTDLTELSDAPIGTIAKDKGEDLWVKARYGWTLRGGYIKLPEKYAPYTVVHTPPSDPANL